MNDQIRIVRMIVYSGTSSDNEWQRAVQRMTTSGTTNENEWQQAVRVTTSDTESEHEWQRVTKNGNEWQRVINEWIRMKVGTTGRFYDSKETKGQSGSWIILFNFICNTVRRCFSKYVFLKFATSTVKHLCWSLFLIKMQAWRPVTLPNRDSCFSVNIAKFLRKFYLKNTSGGCSYTWNSSGIWWLI